MGHQSHQTPKKIDQTSVDSHAGLNFLAAIVSIGFGFQPVLAQDTGVSSSPLTAATTDPKNPINDAVVSIQSVQMQGSSPSCTGVLVAPTLVLTAGHCLEAAIVAGGSGLWDSQSPIWRRYQIPTPTPNTGWISRIRSPLGPIVTNRIIAPFNYDQAPATNIFDCDSRCEGSSRCKAWTYHTMTRMCFLKEQPRFVVNFGNTHGSTSFSLTSSEYSVPGFSDIAIMRLASPVPSRIAIPAPVSTHLPDTLDGVRRFLGAQTYQAVGFTSAQPTRQSAPMTFTQYPYLDGIDSLGDINMVVVGGRSQIQPGDSGSPLFITRTVAGHPQRYVIGINQGVGPTGNRYSLTGINLRQRGELLRMPYVRSNLDLRRASPTGEWLNNVLYSESYSRSAQRPLFNWYSADRKDNKLSSDPRWVSDPRGCPVDTTGQYLDPNRHQNGYRMYRHEGFVFDPKATQPPGTVPLWSWFNPVRNDNFTTSDPRWGVALTRLRWSGEQFAAPQITRDGYTLYRLEGYIYSPLLPQPPDTLPLYSWFHPGRNDNFHTTDPAWSVPVSALTRSGENLSGEVVRDGYQLFRLEGYVPMNPQAHPAGSG